MVEVSASAAQRAGAVPTEIGLLTEMDIFSLKKNFFSGTLPTQLGRLTDMNYFYLFSNKFCSEVPTEVRASAFSPSPTPKPLSPLEHRASVLVCSQSFSPHGFRQAT